MMSYLSLEVKNEPAATPRLKRAENTADFLLRLSEPNYLEDRSTPSGKSPHLRKILSSPSRKNICLAFFRKSEVWSTPSCAHLRGVSRSSRTWSAGCGG